MSASKINITGEENLTSLLETTFQFLDKQDYDAASKVADHIRNGLDATLINNTRPHMVRAIKDLAGDNKEIRILDLGCGYGISIFCLMLLGYKNVVGVDICPLNVPTEAAKLLGFPSVKFEQYDGKNTSLETESFDVVISEQVLEHVFEIEAFYNEIHRLIKPNGSAILSFPHRYKLFDSHGQTWFLHMFPRNIYLGLAKMVGRDATYLAKLLNLQSIKYHKKIAKSYFPIVENIAWKRLVNMSSNEFLKSKGHKSSAYQKARLLVHRVFKLPVIGQIAARSLAPLSDADLVLRKRA